MPEQTLKEKTAKGLFWGGVSNGVQQLLGVLIGIVLLKNLTPDDYGMVGMLAIFTAIASTIQESGFTAALTNRPEFKSEDYNAVFWFNLIVGSIIYVVLFFSAPFIALFFKQPELELLSRVLFLSILIGSFGIAHNAVLFRKLMVKERAKVDIFSIAIAGVVGIYMAVNGFGYWALVIQTLIFTFVGTVLRFFYSSWIPSFSFKFYPIREMFSFSFRLLISSIINQIQLNIFSVLLGKSYTVADVGYYSQGTKWSGMGMNMMNGMINGVAQPIFAQVKQDRDKQVQVFRKMLRFIAFTSFPLLLGLSFVGRDLILVINDEWLPCVPILQIYCLWGMLSPIQQLYIQMTISSGNSKFYFWNTIIYSFISIVVSIIILPLGIYWMALSVVVVTFIFLLIWHIGVSRYYPIRLWSVFKDITPYLLITIIVFLVTYLLTMSITNICILLFLKVSIAILLYCFIMYLVDSVIFKECVRYFNKKIL